MEGLSWVGTCEPGKYVVHGTTCTANSQTGFECEQEGERRCRDGQFDAMPECSGTGFEQCQVRNIPGGYWSGHLCSVGASVAVGWSCVFTAQPNSRCTGTGLRRCLDGGAFDEAPTCVGDENSFCQVPEVSGGYWFGFGCTPGAMVSPETVCTVVE